MKIIRICESERNRRVESADSGAFDAALGG